MDDCIFCKIVKGTLPSHVVYEDESNLAFLDVYPAVPGFMVVIPKRHFEYVWDMSDEKYDLLMKSVKAVAGILKKGFPESLVGVQIEGLDVSHAHVKVLPFSSRKEFIARGDGSIEPDHKQLAELAAQLRY